MLFYPNSSSVFVFTPALMLDSQFLCILAIFLSVFCRISAVFMPFLRSASFADPLLLDKSAFYLTANQYHSEGRREAEGMQNEGGTVSLPILSLLASCRFCKDFCWLDTWQTGESCDHACVKLHLRMTGCPAPLLMVFS